LQRPQTSDSLFYSFQETAFELFDGAFIAWINQETAFELFDVGQPPAGERDYVWTVLSDTSYLS